LLLGAKARQTHAGGRPIAAIPGRDVRKLSPPEPEGRVQAVVSERGAKRDLLEHGLRADDLADV
jgi:hypothetical protein